MSSKRSASDLTSPRPSKKLAIEPKETYGDFNRIETHNILPQILGLLDRVSLQRFTSTCQHLRKYIPRNVRVQDLKPEDEVKPLDMLEIHILDVANLPTEYLRKTFGNYEKVKHLRIKGTGMIGDNKEDQQTLEYGILDARDFFTELISLELVQYHLCFDFTVDDENFENLQALRLSDCIYNERHEIEIGIPLQDIGLYFDTEPISGLCFDDEAKIPLLNIEKGVQCKNWHGNCRVEMKKGYDQRGNIIRSFKDLIPRK